MIKPGRTRKALMRAAFAYGQFLIAFATIFVVTPQVLRVLGARRYGLWLSTGELVGYVLLLDFGVFSVLPWLIAHAEGRGDQREVKRLLSQGLAVAGSLLLALLLVAVVLWRRLPAALHLTATDWSGLAGPLALLIVLLAINLPVNIFVPLLTGIQDVEFLGISGLVKALLGPGLIVALLWTGHGLYALAIGTALMPPLAGFAAAVRARWIAPDLLRGWPRPTWGGATRLFRESIGPWLASVGVQLMERSSAVVLTVLGNPAAVPVLVCTSRVGQTLTQMAWVMPDSALVGLAQLSGESNPERAREITLSIIRLNLILAGLMACVVLAINPGFVRVWVGERFFGGLPLNGLLAAEVVSASFAHGVATVVAVQGHRLNIGLATMAQGALYVALAFTLTPRLALEGLLIADLLAPLCSIIPVGLWILRSTHGLGFRRIGGELASLLIVRAGPCLLAAGVYGTWRARDASLPELTGVGLLVSLLYLRMMGSQLSSFPLPPAANIWLRRLRLV